MKNVSFHSQSGKSILEIVVVLAVTGIVSTFAVMQLTGARGDLKRQNIARELKISLDRARFDSLKRRPAADAEMAQVTIIDSTSFTVSVDLNQNGVLDASDSRQLSFPNAGVRIAGNGLVFPVTIRFNRFGHTIATNGVGVTINSPVFLICENCSSNSAVNSSNSNLLTVSPTGTVTIFSPF